MGSCFIVKSYRRGTRHVRGHTRCVKYVTAAFGGRSKYRRHHGIKTTKIVRGHCPPKFRIRCVRKR